MYKYNSKEHNDSTIDYFQCPSLLIILPTIAALHEVYLHEPRWRVWFCACAMRDVCLLQDSCAQISWGTSNFKGQFNTFVPYLSSSFTICTFADLMLPSVPGNSSTIFSNFQMLLFFCSFLMSTMSPIEITGSLAGSLFCWLLLILEDTHFSTF